jgi:hypothetical protein
MKIATVCELVDPGFILLLAHAADCPCCKPWLAGNPVDDDSVPCGFGKELMNAILYPDAEHDPARWQ